MHACARLQVRAIREPGTFDVGADVVLGAARAEVDLRRRLVHLRRRAEETHGWMDGWKSVVKQSWKWKGRSCCRKSFAPLSF